MSPCWGREGLPSEYRVPMWETEIGRGRSMEDCSWGLDLGLESLGEEGPEEEHPE